MQMYALNNHVPVSGIELFPSVDARTLSAGYNPVGILAGYEGVWWGWGYWERDGSHAEFAVES